MTKILLTLLLFSSSMILTVSHPCILAGLLVLVALMSSFLLGSLSLTWLLYVLALVFLGGVMVVLLFMVSVCGNEKFFKEDKKSLVSLMIIYVSLFICSPYISLSQSFSGFQLSSVLYETESALAFMMLMSLLILCMISVVTISSLESGPLVKRL